MQSYLITDPFYYGSTSEILTKKLEDVLTRHQPDMICFRDKESPYYRSLAETCVAVCRRLGVPKVLLHGDVTLSVALGADGVHLTSAQFDQITKAKANGLYVVVSTHAEEEMEAAVRLGADAVTYSPIFPTPNKGRPKGLEDLKERVGKISANIIALGGITTPAQVEAVEQTGVYGFASIRYFIEN